MSKGSVQNLVQDEIATFKMFAGCGPISKKHYPMCHSPEEVDLDTSPLSLAEANEIHAKLAEQKKEISKLKLKKRLNDLRTNKERLERMSSQLERRLENRSSSDQDASGPSNRPCRLAPNVRFNTFGYVAHFEPRQMGMTIRTDFKTG